MKELQQVLAPILRRLRLLTRRALIKLVFDDAERQRLQLGVYQNETLDDVEHFQGYGRTVVPPLGGEAVLVAIGGNQEQLVALRVEDRSVRPRGLQALDNCLYHAEGHNLLLTENGTGILTLKRLVINAADSIEMNTKQLTINASQAVDITTPKHSVSGESYAADFEAGGIRYLGHKHQAQGEYAITSTPK
ncbi:phage baseplate assembly protein V [Shewanella algae]|uniref:phage baseplate assembly protein V n=1 Tax=Shewanella algae TaxID=38313 RepID=UPI0031F5BDC6